VFALPSSFLFSPDGKVKRAFTGFVAEDVLEAELKNLLASIPEPVSPSPEPVSYQP
jgi:hypothetical protein